MLNVWFLSSLQRHICTISGSVKLATFTWFLDFEQSMPLSFDLRSTTLSWSNCFENGANGKMKVFSWFHGWKFKHESTDLKIFTISTNEKKFISTIIRLIV